MTSIDSHPPSRQAPADRHAAGPGPAADTHDNELVDHEHSDINVRTVLMFGGVLVIVTVVCQVLMWVLFGVLERQAAANDPQLSPLAIPAGKLPPEPQLQTNEPAGLAKFRAAEAKMLEGYGWVDQPLGVARMPIGEAKKLILERGLPVRAGAPVDPGLGTHAPAMGEASGGRNIPVRPPGTAKPAGDPGPVVK